MNWTSKLVTWQKPNGELVDRIVSYNMYHIGQTNCYKWKIVDIKYFAKKKFVTKAEWEKAIKRDDTMQKIKFSVQSYLTKVYKQLIYLMSLLISMKVFELIKGTSI